MDNKKGRPKASKKEIRAEIQRDIKAQAENWVELDWQLKQDPAYKNLEPIRPKPQPARQRRLIPILIGVFLALLLAGGAAAASWEQIREFFAEHFPEYTAVGNQWRDSAGAYQDLDGYPLPAYLPEGYHFEQSRQNESFVEIPISGPEASEAIIFQIGLDNFGCLLDTEGTVGRKITIGDKEGIMCNCDGTWNLVWGVEPQYYLYGEIASDELIKIAESVN